MQEEISILIQAQYPLIYLVTSEEERCEQAISTIAQAKPQRRVFIWTVTHGIVEYGQPRTTTQHNTVSPEAAIEWVIRQREPNSNASIYIFKDLHPFIDSPPVTRWLRDAIANFKGTQKTIILMSPLQQIPIELEKEVVVLDFALPDMKELNQVLSGQLEQTKSRRIDYRIIFVKRARCCRIRLPTSTLLAQSSYFSAALGQHQQYINSHYIAGGQNGNN